MSNEKYYMLWNMTRKCNFQCKYCYFPHDSSPVESNLSVEKILEFLDSTQKEWTIGMTGGEPFMYPHFVQLSEKLTEKHKISIDSNLSFNKHIKRFASTITPKKVVDIYAALHIEERERLKGVDQFIENVLLLIEKGFHVSVNYVIHPTLVKRFKSDFEYFKSRGIKLLPRPFKGIFNGKDYPLNYSTEEKALFSLKPKAGSKIVYNFRGVPCDAGRRLIRLEPDGTIFRCSGDRTILGNVNYSVQLFPKPNECNMNRCPCFGSDYVLLDKEQKYFMQGIRDYMIGNLDKSAEYFYSAIKLNPQASNSYCNLGVIYWDNSDIEQALACFKKALEIHPGNKIYIMNTAMLLTFRGLEEEAIKLIKSFSTKYRDKDIEDLEVSIYKKERSDYSGKICVDVISDNTRTDIFKIG